MAEENKISAKALDDGAMDGVNGGVYARHTSGVKVFFRNNNEKEDINTLKHLGKDWTAFNEKGDELNKASRINAGAKKLS